MSIVRKLSKPRFEALLYRRKPLTHLIRKELEWWSNDDESLIATVSLDLIDNDFSWVALGRDEKAVLRAVALNVSKTTIEDARAELHERMAELSESGDKVFPQGDTNEKKHEILVPCVQTECLHPHFRYLMQHPGYSPARGIMSEMGFAFTDLDGNFRQDLQTTGFDRRLWELYLYVFFYEQRFDIDDSNQVPDFIVRKGDWVLGIEATTVNATDGITPPYPESADEER
jgi:hypothetical protein